MTAVARRREAEQPSSFALQISEGRRPKTVLSIPESHTLYVCPTGCARRRAVRAIENGIDAACSYLVLDEADVVSGDYEGCIRDAVDEILAAADRPPRVLTVATPCIDYLLSTDLDGLCAELGNAHPGTHFLPNRLAPIGAKGAKKPEALGVYTALFQPLLTDVDRAGAPVRDKGATVLGSYVPLPATSEIYGALELMGARPVRDLVTCASYDDYLSLAKSRAALVVSHVGIGAAKLLGERFGMPHLLWQACYGIEETLDRYRGLARMLGHADVAGLEEFLAPHADRARRARTACASALKGYRVAVDTAATMAPFSLALDLVDAGLDVACVLALHSKGNDEREDELLKRHPEVRVVRTKDTLAMLGDSATPGTGLVALGRDASALLHAEHAVNIYHDEGFFGLDGIARLFDAVRARVEG